MPLRRGCVMFKRAILKVVSMAVVVGALLAPVGAEDWAQWRGPDRHKFKVALKILPDAFAADPERLARFKREAQILASLNHPNIAAIHGLGSNSMS